MPAALPRRENLETAANLHEIAKRQKTAIALFKTAWRRVPDVSDKRCSKVQDAKPVIRRR